MTRPNTIAAPRTRRWTEWLARWQAVLYPGVQQVDKAAVLRAAAEAGGWTLPTFRRICDGRNAIPVRGWLMLEALEAIRALVGPDSPLPLDAGAVALLRADTGRESAIDCQ